MTTNQVGTLHGSTLGFGLGFETVERYGASGSASPGTFGWAGAYGSNYKVDPDEGLVIVVLINQLPAATDIVARFQTMLYSALVESRARLREAHGRSRHEPASTARIAGAYDPVRYVTLVRGPPAHQTWRHANRNRSRRHQD